MAIGAELKAQKNSPDAERRLKALGVMIKDARESMRLSQTDFGRLVGGATQATVSRWECGRGLISVEHVRSIEKVARLPLGTLLRKSGYVSAAADGVEIDTMTAIAADPTLAPEFRSHVLESYKQWREASKELLSRPQPRKKAAAS